MTSRDLLALSILAGLRIEDSVGEVWIPPAADQREVLGLVSRRDLVGAEELKLVRVNRQSLALAPGMAARPRLTSPLTDHERRGGLDARVPKNRRRYFLSLMAALTLAAMSAGMAIIL